MLLGERVFSAKIENKAKMSILTIFSFNTVLHIVTGAVGQERKKIKRCPDQKEINCTYLQVA